MCVMMRLAYVLIIYQPLKDERAQCTTDNYNFYEPHEFINLQYLYFGVS